MKILGIDPGLDGCLAVLDIGDTTNVRFFDTPTLTLKGAKKTFRVIDTAEIVNILMREVGRNANVQAVLEKVSAAPIGMKGRGVQPCAVCHRTPQPGSASTFNFGVGFGIWQGVLAALQIPYSLVHPATWKAQIMRDRAKDKGASIIRAKELYPQAAASLNLKKHHGRADALLLAHYGKQFLSQGDRDFDKPKEFSLESEEGPF
jgi:hypothetical protein